MREYQVWFDIVPRTGQWIPHIVPFSFQSSETAYLFGVVEHRSLACEMAAIWLVKELPVCINARNHAKGMTFITAYLTFHHLIAHHHSYHHTLTTAFGSSVTLVMPFGPPRGIYIKVGAAIVWCMENHQVYLRIRHRPRCYR